MSAKTNFFQKFDIKKKRVWFFFNRTRKKIKSLKKVWSKIEKIWSNLIDLIFMLNSKSIEFELFDFWNSNLTPIRIKFESRSPPHLAKIRIIRTMQVYNTNNASSANIRIPIFLLEFYGGAGVLVGLFIVRPRYRFPKFDAYTFFSYAKIVIFHLTHCTFLVRVFWVAS